MIYTLNGNGVYEVIRKTVEKVPHQTRDFIKDFIRIEYRIRTYASGYVHFDILKGQGKTVCK